MVGDRVVRVPAPTRRGDHLLQRREPVGEVRVGMEVTLDVLLLHERRELPAKGRLDLAAVLAERRRDPGQAEPLVDLLLGPGHDQLTGLRVEQTVLGELQALSHRDLAGADVVGLRASEVLQRRPPDIRGDDPQVHLQPLDRADGRLRLAAGDDALDVGERCERLHDRRRLRRRHQDVDVADRLSHAPERPRVGDLARLLEAAESPDHVLGELHGHVDLHARAGFLDERDPAKDVLLGSVPEPAQALQAPGVDRGRELLYRGDAQVPVQEHRLLRAETRDRHHLAHAGRDGRPEVLERGEGPRPQCLLDLAGGGLADARDRLEAFLVERGDLGVIPADRPGGLLVGANPEGIAARDREEVRVLLEQGLDDLVGAGHGRSGQSLSMSQSRSAFCVCSRFSAWSHTTECGPSITSSVISWPRCAGRQCSTMQSGFARSTAA